MPQIPEAQIDWAGLLPEFLQTPARAVGRTLSELTRPIAYGAQGYGPDMVTLSDLADIPQSKEQVGLTLASMLPMGKAAKALKSKSKQIQKGVQEGMDWFAKNYPELWQLAKVQHGTGNPMYREDLGEVHIPLYENLTTLDTIDKLAHEFKHAEQAANKVKYAEEKVGPWQNYEAYRKHASEAESREFAESVKQRYLEALSPEQRYNAKLGRNLDAPIPAKILAELLK